RVIPLLADSFEIVERRFHPPFVYVVTLEVRRLHTVRTLTLAQTHRLEGIDNGIRSTKVSDRVALRANLYSPNNGIDHAGPAKFPGRDQCARTSRQQELPRVTS